MPNAGKTTHANCGDVRPLTMPRKLSVLTVRKNCRRKLSAWSAMLVEFALAP
jgi:hypothetical protein